MANSEIVHVEKNTEITAALQRNLSKEFGRIFWRARSSSRSVVKSALRELRDLANSINTSLIRSYEADQYIRRQREKLIQQRFYW